MISNARWGMWETNSSSVHQMVIKTDEKKKYMHLHTLEIRDEYFDLEDHELYTPQEKLDVVVQAIVQHESAVSKAIFHILKLADLLKKLPQVADVQIDTESFKKNKWPDLSKDLSESICNMLESDPDKIVDLILNADSIFCGCDNCSWENSDHLFVHECEGNSAADGRNSTASVPEGYYVVTGQY